MLNSVRKGLNYLKERGVREFVSKTAETFSDAHFDYSRYMASRRLSPLAEGYQKTLRMRQMPRIWVMILRPERTGGTQAEDEDVDAGAQRAFREAYRRTVRSVQRQTYSRIEICDVLTTRTKGDDLAVFIQAGDLLPEDAFFEVVSASQNGALCLYTDEDRFRREQPGAEGGDSGRIRFEQPAFKPDYNPDYLRSMNYIGHLFAVRADVLRKAARLSGREDFASAWNLSAEDAYYEMVLLCTDLARGKTVHLPSVLYHGYLLPDSGAAALTGTADTEPAETETTAAEPGADGGAVLGGEPDSNLTDAEMRSREQGELLRGVLKRDLQRRGESGIVEYGPVRKTFHVRYLTDGVPLVSIVIPSRDHAALLRQCLDSIRLRTTWENLDIVIVENGSSERETFEFYGTLRAGSYRGMPVRVIRYSRAGFSFSNLVNEGMDAARGEYAVLLNNDVTVKSADWVERLLGQCRREKVGAAGPKLLYPDGTVQSAGIVAGIMGFAGSMMVGEREEDAGYMNRASLTQDMSAVTAACMMVRRSVYRKIGGFSPELAVALNDVDFCLRLNRAGYRVVYDPSVEMFHHESRSRGYEDTGEKRKRFEQEKRIFRSRWEDLLKKGDPCYNPNLSLRKCDYSPRTERMLRR